MKVLIAVDGSSHSLEAVSQIGALLSAQRDQVILYCSPSSDSRMLNYPQLQASAREAFAKTIFDEACKRLPSELESNTLTVVDTHDPRSGIVQAAEQAAADLIVLGARGLGTFERLLLGSVSRAVVHASTIPVWVVRTTDAAPSRAGHKVLIACESPQGGRHLAETIEGLAWPADTACFLMSVVQPLFAGQVPQWLQNQPRSPEVEEMVQSWAREHQQEVQARRTAMEQLAAELSGPCQTSRVLVAEGAPETELLGTAEREGVNLIVVGTRQRGTLANFILGSTSEAILNHARCSVLVAPMR